MSLTYETITPSAAMQYLSLTADFQRRIDARRVCAYAADMESGRWKDDETVIRIGRHGGREYLLSGQHRLSAIVRSGRAICFKVERVEYGAYGDMLAAYATSNGGKTMSTGNVLNTLGTGPMVGIPPTLAPRFGAAFRFIAMEFGLRHSRVLTASRLHDIILAWEKPVYAYWRIVPHGGARTRMFYKIPVLSVGLITLKYCPEKAVEFWGQAYAQEGLRRGEPVHTLVTNVFPSLLTTHGEVFSETARVACCWNAFYEGRELMRTSTHTSGNLRIAGTPVTGKGRPDVNALLGIEAGEGL